MTYMELFNKANSLLDSNQITIGEYDEMTSVLRQEISDHDYKETFDKIDRLGEIMREGKFNADHMLLPSESQSRANSLMKEAIELIEEITGEEWEFTYLTF